MYDLRRLSDDLAGKRARRFGAIAIFKESARGVGSYWIADESFIKNPVGVAVWSNL